MAVKTEGGVIMLVGDRGYGLWESNLRFYLLTGALAASRTCSVKNISHNFAYTSRSVSRELIPFGTLSQRELYSIKLVYDPAGEPDGRLILTVSAFNHLC